MCRVWLCIRAARRLITGLMMASFVGLMSDGALHEITTHRRRIRVQRAGGATAVQLTMIYACHNESFTLRRPTKLHCRRHVAECISAKAERSTGKTRARYGHIRAPERAGENAASGHPKSVIERLKYRRFDDKYV